MLARIRKAAEDKDSGFTLIELLVVMIIIGILAAIAIPVFLNQRKKAVDTSIKSDLRTVANELETYYTDNQAYVAVATNTAGTNKVTVGSTDVKLSSNNVVALKLVKQGTGGAVVAATDATDAQGFCLTGTNAKSSGNVITYNSLAGGLGNTAC
ncbi:prepilin-type N-terminal cleavage/methylation domain-containing protein [Angustibacter luteus]|uniref:Type II secretion system protein n=1 Tax=Angustibacter luteus TaxID=658456 RepID=A0ABW1JA81_9ACTN